MRIQHNIPAMNAYRNYNSNTKALQSNLQKLSSGYKINKAGDDAAGLAISEKMRAQITGLEVAQKNAKDGISLVQTAEGAMTEIHTMLNRMFSLAEQSANGTYDDDVDRAQLNNEFEKLRNEIDRIADATNFNGKYLLNGSESAAKQKNSSNVGNFSDIGSLLTAVTDVKAIEASSTATLLVADTGATKWSTVDGGTMTFSVTDSQGKKTEITLTVDATALKDKDGNALTTGVTANTRLDADQATIGKAIKEALSSDSIAGDFAKKYDVAVNNTTGALTFKAKNSDEDVPSIVAMNISFKDSTGTDTTAAAGASLAQTEAADAFKAVDLSQATVFDSTDATKTADDLKNAAFTIDGQKFAFAQVANAGDAIDLKWQQAAKDAGITLVATTNTTPTNTDVKNMADAITLATGLEVKQGTVAANAWTDAPTTLAGGETFITVSEKEEETPADGTAGAAAADKKGIRLRVGDSTQSYDDIYVDIQSMKVDKLIDMTDVEKGGTGLTLDKLGIGYATKEDAAKAIQDKTGPADLTEDMNADTAMDALKGMINYVSNERGKLGATQNRLDHTINNLSTMQENIQDAEATIRDVDVAEEMMKYTKNNILVQSAQAMLAQANQLPQGVLQLLG